jgi:hypothetical protein
MPVNQLEQHSRRETILVFHLSVSRQFAKPFVFALIAAVPAADERVCGSKLAQVPFPVAALLIAV